MSVGKKFEAGLVKGCKQLWPEGLVERWPDKMATNKDKKRFVPASHKSPFDMVVWLPQHGMIAIECKAAQGQSIALNRLAEHQANALNKVDATPGCNGIVAVIFHSGRQDTAEAYMIPIMHWLSAQAQAAVGGRKSFPIAECRSNNFIRRIDYNKGGIWIPELP